MQDSQTPSKLKLIFMHGDEGADVENVFLITRVPGMERVNCRESYTPKFGRVKVIFDCGGLRIICNDPIPPNKTGELIIPEFMVMSIGIDYESERTE